jgi:hypothetical protein
MPGVAFAPRPFPALIAILSPAFSCKHFRAERSRRQSPAGIIAQEALHHVSLSKSFNDIVERLLIQEGIFKNILRE